MKVDILGVSFDNVTMEEALAQAEAMLSDGQTHYIVTPNAEFVQMAKRDSQFRGLLNGADLVIPDGIGVIYASKILGQSLQGRVPGIEFGAGLCDRLARWGGRLFLLGAKPGVAERAAEHLRAEHSGLTICGVHDGYFREDGPVVEEIRASRADVIFVCLGAPKQERWMVEYGEATGGKILVGLGGSLDVFAGEVKRAPEQWQKLGLEWLYRLLKQPQRIGRIAKLPLFLMDAAAERISGSGNSQTQRR